MKPSSSAVPIVLIARRSNFLTIIYDRILEKDAFFDDDFKAGVVAAGARARMETLAVGVSVFYRDGAGNIDMMEEPSGRKFEIRYVSYGLSDWNYEIVA